MKKHKLAFSLFSFFILVIAFNSCKKINEATLLGGELIPPIDNVTTFDTTLTVEAYNGIFTDAEDTVRSVYTDEQFLGYISNDPLFGKTNASMFIQLKPSFPFAFAAARDSSAIDSVVLVLSYHNTYGDTTQPLRISAYELAQSNQFTYTDTAYLLKRNDFVTSSLLGSAMVTPKHLHDSLNMFQEQAANQLRIKLDNSFGSRLLSYDSTNAYRSDSAFNTYFKGFGIYADSTSPANALMGFALADTNTKLAIYYKYVKEGVRDTAVTYFRFTGTSASANHISRNYAGAEMALHQGSTTPENLLYIQNSPGSYARVKISGLGGLNNSIIHLAQLTVQQVFDPSDLFFTPPQYLYLDAYDTAKKGYRTIPYDVTLDPTTGYPNQQTFGMVGKPSRDASGNTITIWNFTISRYVQHIVNKTSPVYEFRLSSPIEHHELYSLTADNLYRVPINSTYAKGRVRVGGGNHPAQPMKLYIVYSKL